MSEFKKYMHIERFGTGGVDGIELGECYIFPKIDGTNGSVWLDENGDIKSGSRNRQLTEDADNADFCKFVNGEQGVNIRRFIADNPHLRLFGEWLVPHTLKTYRDDAWRKFYVFDVFSDETGEYLHYDNYSSIVGEYGIDFITPICIVKNPHIEKLINLLDSNLFLLRDGEGFGEGIVIKNYYFKNRFGRTVWAKIVRNEFKEKHSRNSDVRISNQTEVVEQKIIDEFVTASFVNKTYSKVSVDGWSSKMIPKLIGMVFYDLVTEEIWNICKSYKMPRVDFKRLNNLCIQKIKETKPELF